MRLGRFWVPLIAVFGCFALSASAKADFTWVFDTVVTGDAPGGPSPWASLNVQDSGANQVTFTLTHDSDSAAGQFFTELLLNFSPAFPGDFAFSTPDSNKVLGASWGTDSFTDAGSMYDIQVLFETSGAGGGVNRIKPGESVSWTFTGTGVDSTDFNTMSVATGGAGTWLALLHVQGIGENNEGSGKIAPVPEPASMIALSLGAAGLIARRRRARKS